MGLLVLLVVGCLLSISHAQINPEACTCPDECICDSSIGIIDCTGAHLAFVPVELNSCSWPGITKIDLSSNRIKELEEYSFSLQHNVTHLYLYDNEIQEIDRNAFVGMRSLQHLFLDGNRITSLHSRVFRSVRKLKRLLLYSNLITTLPFGIFAENSELSILALHENRLSHLEVEIFDDVPLLTELYLHGNQLTDLSNSPFRSLTKLNLLYLSDNRLSRLTRFDFSGLFSLTTLLLSNNFISTIDNEAFNPLQELEYLYLENNLLTEINILVFAPPVKLQNLRIFNNRISSITNGAFFRLRKLKFLSLHSNRLTEITPQTFVGLDSITELVLYNNKISKIQDDTFVQCPLMERLWLYNNNISCLEPNAFKGMSRLQILQLGTNRLSYLPNDLFQNTLELQYLLLYSNNLKSISNQPFRNLRQLVQLSIYFNPIKYIAEGALDGADSLYYIQFSENGDEDTLVCDCSSLWLYHWMVGRPLQASMVCGSPPQFAGHDIRSLQPASFGCSSVHLGIEVGPQCDNHVIQVGGCLHLTCSSSPSGPITWSRLDGQPIRSIPYSCSGGSLCSGGGRDEGTLIVENVTPDDAGIYVCTASFLNDTATDICRVIVGEPPQLLAAPEDMYLAYPGPLARFSVRFTGTPKPTVQWYQITSTGSEIALHETGPRSRYVISEYGTLVILDTMAEDEGRYKAVIKNGAGEISVETELYYYFQTSCRAECQNGGTCVSLHVCRCSEDFAGRYCDTYAGEEIESTTEPPQSTLAPSIPLTTAPPTNSESTPSTPSTSSAPLSQEPPTDQVSGSGSGSSSGGSGYESGSTFDWNDIDIDGLEGLADDEDYGLDYKRQVRRERRSLAHFGRHSLLSPSQGHQKRVERLRSQEEEVVVHRPVEEEKVESPQAPEQVMGEDEIDIQWTKDVELQREIRELYAKEEEFETKLKEVRLLAAAKKRLFRRSGNLKPVDTKTLAPKVPLDLDPVLSNNLMESESLAISSETVIHPSRDVKVDFNYRRQDDADAPEAIDGGYIEHPLPEVPVASWRERK